MFHQWVRSMVLVGVFLVGVCASVGGHPYDDEDSCGPCGSRFCPLSEESILKVGAVGVVVGLGYVTSPWLWVGAGSFYMVTHFEGFSWFAFGIGRALFQRS